ncbi:hypothetical protein [Streptomyces mobaraensis]|uniref:DNA primase n=1 Tax=Streptomyces mobaraensis TaxID=35621 RepID=A0A5N5WEA1_STRMB|nr:hypothetical protein [Streptomyces mobaraensis]KAB7850109.1 hypothetical protein FRZ00_05775 [Streptomyces mobaraensis]
MFEVLAGRDALACARAYTKTLGWPVTRGHRYRPRAGCTCRDTTDAPCPTPGAHPVTGPPAEERDDDLALPGASLIAPTLAFDIVIAPSRVGMAAMVSLDRETRVPCAVTRDEAALFTQAGTGRYAIDALTSTCLVVRTGPEGWVALPPSHGVRWDTPPWDEASGAALPLPHGGRLHAHFTKAVRLAGTEAEAVAPHRVKLRPHPCP